MIQETPPPEPFRALDLFCCAGGATRGLQQAGFHVTGVDIRPQPRYIGDAFVQADALGPLPFSLSDFDFIWASPPCQAYSVTARIHPDKKHPDLVATVRTMLAASGVPYVIENVSGAPLRNPFTLCGTMFGLKVYRHRLFEASFFVMVPGHHEHRETTNANRGYSSFEDGAEFISLAGNNFKREDGAAAMGVDWPTTRPELAQAIPPAYSHFIGKAAMQHLRQSRMIHISPFAEGCRERPANVIGLPPLGVVMERPTTGGPASAVPAFSFSQFWRAAWKDTQPRARGGRTYPSCSSQRTRRVEQSRAPLASTKMGDGPNRPQPVSSPASPETCQRYARDVSQPPSPASPVRRPAAASLSKSPERAAATPFHR